MTSTFHGLEVGKRSLYTQQAALTTTGHNIANANTPGYSRQRVNMQATSPITYPYQTGSTSSQLGTGVSVQSIERIRSEYLDGQYRERNSMLGSESTKLETMQQIESLSGEPGENGISASLDRFWSAWEDLASNPDSTAARSVVVGRAEELLDQAKSFNKGLASLADSLGKQEAAVRNQISSLSSQIESLNQQISKNGNANDLMDRRDLLKDQLSGLARYTKEGELVGGKLMGIQDSIKVTENMKSDLNEMFETLISGKEATATEGKVKGLNELMESGYSLIRNADGTMQEGKPLFASDGNGAFLEGTTINQEVKANPSTIGASSKNDTISNGEIASSISDLRNKTFTFKLAGSDDSITTNVNDYYSTLVTRLASSAQSSERTVSNHESVLQSIDNNRMSVSGVSLDEEMANLVQFQHAYNAAARYISTTDEILDVIINRMGV
ncbi:flagellar hook-associated protein FlgK [Pseudalkalibacillus hwajinpoensis]|uniref:Flagellar hook-associated protein 1 n=1 Tax=Guptibacillus hwajinpoensis TaxID=208199 RepID=A0A4U1MJ58_9BACL|nr:flagellar hook-associated protein FlgK [Pseudalkalibacillus hwajinpoensis]TKD70536.1 flagellar hook-associated protein FlgK [Pseudalkalibacillus hwajinpoensis]